MFGVQPGFRFIYPCHLTVQIESIFHLPLQISGPIRYGGKFAHKCIPESSGFEQM